MIDNKLIIAFDKKLKKDDVNNILLNSISNNSPDTIFLNRELLNNYNHIFSKKRQTNQAVSNQFNTGRCWIFSFNNVLRNKLINKYKLPDDFNLSSNFLSFYDKLEKCNYFLELMISTKNYPIDNDLVKHFLDEPISDGGSWNMAINIVEKYGIVPDGIMKESYNASNTSHLNKFIIQNLKRFAHNIRSKKKINKNKMIFTIYKILCFFLGKPPKQFIWEYHDKVGNYNRYDNMNPSLFYKKFVKLGVGFNPDDYITCINYPLDRFPFYKVFKLDNCTNIKDENEFICFNLPIDEIIKLVKTSIDNDELVFFGSDVGKYYYDKQGILDTNIFNYDPLFSQEVVEMNKGDKLTYRQSFPNHAMVFIGYNKYNNKINKLAVENTWGTNSGNKGFITMSKEWFNEYCYLFVIHKDYFNKKQLSKYTKAVSKKINIKPWDILACEALKLN